MYVYPTSILTFSALLLSLPHEGRAAAETFIVEDMRWLLKRGWKASITLPCEKQLATWKSHCARPFCAYRLCQLAKKHTSDCPYQSATKLRLRTPLIQPDGLLPAQAILNGSSEDQALVLFDFSIVF